MYFYFQIDGNEIISESEQLHFSSTTGTAYSKIKSVLENDTIQANDILGEFFPSKQEYDIFISHSHSDIKKARWLANVLYRDHSFISFIDSEFWFHKDELQKMLDESYAKFENKEKYYYDKRNITTTHVNIILSHALKEMMDKCKCIIFLNTPNSVNVQEAVKEPTTYSPWIFYELSVLKTLRMHSRPRRVNLSAQRESNENYKVDMKIEYDISQLEDIPKLTMNELIENNKINSLHNICEYIERDGSKYFN